MKHKQFFIDCTNPRRAGQELLILSFETIFIIVVVYYNRPHVDLLRRRRPATTTNHLAVVVTPKTRAGRSERDMMIGHEHLDTLPSGTSNHANRQPRARAGMIGHEHLDWTPYPLDHLIMQITSLNREQGFKI